MEIEKTCASCEYVFTPSELQPCKDCLRCDTKPPIMWKLRVDLASVNCPSNCDTCKYCSTQPSAEPCANCLVSTDDPIPTMYEPRVERETESDNVNHPAHYETGKFECIDVMLEALGVEIVKGFCLGNAFKYIYRCKRKGNEQEDIQKAVWYLTKYLTIDDSD